MDRKKLDDAIAKLLIENRRHGPKYWHKLSERIREMGIDCEPNLYINRIVGVKGHRWVIGQNPHTGQYNMTLGELPNSWHFGVANNDINRAVQYVVKFDALDHNSQEDFINSLRKKHMGAFYRMRKPEQGVHFMDIEKMNQEANDLDEFSNM